VSHLLSGTFFLSLFKIHIMKIIIQSDILLPTGIKRKGDVIDIDNVNGQDLIDKGIGIIAKEQKIKKETKELKTPKKKSK